MKKRIYSAASGANIIIIRRGWPQPLHKEITMKKTTPILQHIRQNYGGNQSEMARQTGIERKKIVYYIRMGCLVTADGYIVRPGQPRDTAFIGGEK